MKLGLVLGICLLGGLVGVACGSSSDDSFNSGGGSGGSSGKSTGGKGGTQSASGGESAGGDGSIAGSGGNNAAGTSAGGSSSSGAGGDGAGGGDTGEAGSANAGTSSGGAANCPDVFGDYTITQTDGLCGDLDDQVTQSLEGTTVNCFLHFVSEGALNSGADLDENGAFEGAQLYVGSVQRNPCSGDYNPNDGSMVVTCGGVGDACTVTLEPQ